MQRLGEGGLRFEAIGLDGDCAAEHGHALFGAAEGEAGEARADERGGGVDAAAEGQLVGLGGAARVAIGGEHVAEEEGGGDVGDLEGQHLARGGGGLVAELARGVGAGDFEEERGLVRSEAAGLGEVVGAGAGRAGGRGVDGAGEVQLGDAVAGD